MHIDKFIKTGQKHEICQDYILTEDWYVIIADGCSGSKFSEVGALHLCLTAAKFLRAWRDDLHELTWEKFGATLINTASVAHSMLDISIRCMDATLIIAYKTETGFRVLMYGDGLILKKDWYGNVEYQEISFTKEHPFYLSYFLNPSARAAYRDQGYEQFSTIVDYNGRLIESSTDSTAPLDWSIPSNDLQAFAIASDGITTWNFQPKTIDVVKDILNFKNTGGPFLQRRMNRHISTFRKKGFHFDDISIGCFMMED